MTKYSRSSTCQTSDVKRMLDATPQIRNKALIHFLVSSGVRIDALYDLKLKHVTDMSHGCKMILVYEDSPKEYHTFLTPESSKVLDLYLGQRKKDHEILDDDFPLFRERYRFGNISLKPISTRALQVIMIIICTLYKKHLPFNECRVRHDHRYHRRCVWHVVQLVMT